MRISGRAGQLHDGWVVTICSGRAEPICGGRAEPIYGGRAEPICGGLAEPICGGRAEPICGGRAEPRPPVCEWKTELFIIIFIPTAHIKHLTTFIQVEDHNFKLPGIIYHEPSPETQTPPE